MYLILWIIISLNYFLPIFKNMLADNKNIVTPAINVIYILYKSAQAKFNVMLKVFKSKCNLIANIVIQI